MYELLINTEPDVYHTVTQFSIRDTVLIRASGPITMNLGRDICHRRPEDRRFILS